jgi:outer membrane receptor protein involved in Fe transport
MFNKTNNFLIGLISLVLISAGELSAEESGQFKTVAGKVLDAETGDPLEGANIIAPNTTVGTTAVRGGGFQLRVSDNVRTLLVSYIGYGVQSVELAAASGDLEIKLPRSAVNLQPVVVSAGRIEQSRTEAPVAISTVNALQIAEVKPERLYQAFNKVPGVLMIDLGNEQHTMAIRQPIQYKAFFLYLEDGIPIRPIGIFNHNALYEINMAGLDRFEVIKGPSSSVYGSNAIGGAANFFTPNAFTAERSTVTLRGSDLGYRRVDFGASRTFGDLGVYIGGYAGRQRDGWRAHSDYDKVSVTARADYRLNERTKLTGTISSNHLDTDMTGSLDSTSFYGQDYSSLQTFTYRKVHATRVRTTLSHTWNENSQSDLSLFFRDNTTAQNPSYRVSRDFSDPTKARGEENDNSFQSYGAHAQHRIYFGFKQASLLSGVTVDYSPSTYIANYLTITRDPASGRFVDYVRHDSLLTNYDVDLFNAAAFSQFEFKPAERLKVVAGLRFDHVGYDFDNHLPSSAFSGSPDGSNKYDRLSPKVGFTCDLGVGRGLYANYSSGFQPPEVGELYRGVRIPTLRPAFFDNYELGGWLALLQGKLYLETTIYQMNGKDEIISILLDDDTSANANAGETRHRGIEYALTYRHSNELEFSLGGTNAQHTFLQYVESGSDYSDNEMNNAPDWIANVGMTYKPDFLKGARLSLEWQHVGEYYLSPVNDDKYGGYSIVNLRLGYEVLHGIELWGNVMNLTDELYATTASKSRWGFSYDPGDPRYVSLGLTLSR